MAKIKITKSSPNGTPADETIFVIEYPSVSRVKVTKKDVENEIDNIDKELIVKQDKKTELSNILTEINKL